MASIIMLLYWLLYSEITETRPCDLGLIALLLLRLMYGKLNHYVIRKLLEISILTTTSHLPHLLSTLYCNQQKLVRLMFSESMGLHQTIFANKLLHIV